MIIRVYFINNKNKFKMNADTKFELFPAYTNSVFWYTETDNPNIVTIHECDCSSHYEHDTMLEYVEKLINSKTYDDQVYWHNMCMYAE